jgi:2-dehydro-3-deoxygluconokinase
MMRSADAKTYDVVTLGETMVMVTPARPEALATAEAFRLEIGGAESNVALYLASLLHSVAWVSRIGDDPLGRRMIDAIAAGGVDTSGVEIDPVLPTGVYFKDPQPSGTRVHYYRAGSAASRMGVEMLAALPLAAARLVHLTGITPALSASCAELVEAVIERAKAEGVPVSFDVNYRGKLWPVETAGPALLRLAALADIVLVGRDEAETLWGTSTADDVRRVLPGVGRLVVKDGAIGATEFAGDTVTFVAAPTVVVVEPVGAGDAFAAGYLSALLQEYAPADALARGHELAARALVSMSDVPLGA